MFGIRLRVFVLLDNVMRDAGLRGAWGLMDWIIVGALTGSQAKKYKPKKEWIQEIVEIAQTNNIPIFLKDNLKQVWQGELIQQFPER